MLEIKHITKKYVTGNFTQVALDDVSVNFRDNEFAAILGPSGSGKTTLLNIIGGLDRYDDGDLVINGVSTKRYKDKDWDAYRNNKIGFIFQAYNLIGHQSVLSNVELALTLSGVSPSERKKRAIEALKKVGLEEHIHKRPNQLSGGQMQRVAIARALINNPDIILADEPTGALDTKTSIQVMDLLEEVAKDKLVIMVTHNPELAHQYANRIVEVKDGHIIHDSHPVETKKNKNINASFKHTRLKFTTALGLSLNNLMTKKGRTALTSFAGSIGIIGIAAILALSSGVNDYISTQETDMLGSYPITLEKQAVDLDAMMNREKKNAHKKGHDKKAVYSKNIVGDTIQETKDMIKTNNLNKFKLYLDNHQKDLKKDVSAIEYSYDITPKVYRNDEKAGVVTVSPASLLSTNSQQSSPFASNSFFSKYSMSGAVSSSWSELVSSQNLRQKQYKLLAGHYPKNYNEVVLVLSENNEVSDYTLYTLGMLDINNMNDMIKAIQDGKKYEDTQHSFDYKEVIGKSYRVFAPSQLFEKKDNVFVDQSANNDYLKAHLNEGLEVKIAGVLRAKKDAEISSGVGYDRKLTNYLMQVGNKSEAITAQLANKKINIMTNKAFGEENSGKTNSFFKMNNNLLKTNTHIQSTTMTLKSSMKPTVTLLGETNASQQTETPEQPEIDNPQPSPPVTNNKYTVTFKNGESVLASSTYQAGATISTFPETNPIRADENGVRYTFVGWVDQAGNYFTSKQLRSVTVTQDETYTAVFASTSTSSKLEDYLTDDEIKKANEALNNYMKQQVQANGGAQFDPSKVDMNQLRDLMNKNLGTNISQAQMNQYMMNYATQYLKQNPKLIDKYMKTYLQAYMKKYEQEYLNKIKSSLASNLNQQSLDALLASMNNTTPTNYEDMMSKLGYSTPEDPSKISLYPNSFDAKKHVENFIKAYNKQAKNDNDKVTYTDLISTVTENITKIVDTISTVLIAFVAISLIVSSIMIAIITYISVLERTKEIGILRALGASKGDISKIFNAETFIEGLLSGIFGIFVSWLITFPVNAYVLKTMQVPHVMVLPVKASFVLIGISVILTLLAGFIPSRIAAKKDPVTALRSE